MNIKILNFRGVAEAAFVADKVTLIVGLNSAGKSSCLQAVGMALARQPLPDGMTKAQGVEILRTGAKEGYVAVTAGDGDLVHLSYPSAEIRTEGKSPGASRFAVGLSSLVDLPPKERADALIHTIKAKPTLADLHAAFAEAGLPAAATDDTWKTIEALGWDGALRKTEEKRAGRKTEYKEATGETWGSTKAEGWKPAGWSDDLDGRTVMDLEQDHTVARGKLEDALRGQGASDAERARLEKVAADEPEWKRLLADVLVEEAAAKRDVEAATAARAALPAVQDATKPKRHVFLCPHCSAGIEVKVVPGDLGVGIAMMSVEAASDEDAATAKALDPAVALKIAGADGDLARANSLLEKRTARVAEARSILQTVSDAAARLAQIRGSGGEGAELTAARAALATAEQRLSIVKTCAAANRLHKQILNGDKMTAILSPTGLRQKKLGEVLVAFNNAMQALTETAEWESVFLQVGEKEISTFYGGRHYALLADNEKFRVRAVLACAMAMADGSEAIVVDGADILDMHSRGGLQAMLASTGKPAIIGMTATLPINRVPDLAKLGAGQTLVIEDGVVRPYDAAVDSKIA